MIMKLTVQRWRQLCDCCSDSLRDRRSVLQRAQPAVHEQWGHLAEGHQVPVVTAAQVVKRYSDNVTKFSVDPAVFTPLQCLRLNF